MLGAVGEALQAVAIRSLSAAFPCQTQAERPLLQLRWPQPQTPLARALGIGLWPFGFGSLRPQVGTCSLIWTQGLLVQ